MIPSNPLKASRQMPWERFITTYGSDYKPLSERHLQLSSRTAFRPAPAFVCPLQTKRETWPIFNQYLYKTTNSTYGSTACAQPFSRYLFSTFPSPFGILAPSFSEAAGFGGSALSEGRAQELARETGHLVGREEKGQLHCVCGGKANVLEQHEAREEPQQKMNVLYEEGMIVLSSHVVPACCTEDVLRSVCREAGLQRLLNPPMASSPIVTNKDAENWEDSAYLRGFRPAVGLSTSTFPQPTSRQCSCCAEEAECAECCCFKMGTFPPRVPQADTLPLAHAQPTLYCTERSRKPLLTEYQASYAAEWPQPQIQLRDFHHRHLPCHWNPHPSLLSQYTAV